MVMMKFPKIGQFRQVVSEMKHLGRYIGQDENDEPTYDHTIKLPTITFTGTVKLHGTNASVCFNPSTGDTWYQSRNEIVTEGFYGMVDFFNENEEALKELKTAVLEETGVPHHHNIAIYGEWCGPGIQKKVALNEIPEKVFVMFGIKSRDPEWGEDVRSIWYNPKFVSSSSSSRIKNIYEFPTYSMDIDFERPKMSINDMVDITNKVEEECPVGKAMGVEGVGEGIVWTAHYKDRVLRFKVKGSKHSNTKTKNLVTVDPEKLATIEKVVDYLVSEQRYNQAISETGAELHRKHTGDLMRWLANDIETEESDTLDANGLTWKDIAGRVTGEYRRMFFEQIDNNF